jgi:membrane protease YdiL (CAAX protease family)
VTLLGGLGEEIGWRGYLLAHLLGLGMRRALLISGLVHGRRHLPVMI